MVAVLRVQRHVQVDDVAVLQRPRVRNAVADDLRVGADRHTGLSEADDGEEDNKPLCFSTTQSRG
jgi:hypothetical protein